MLSIAAFADLPGYAEQNKGELLREIFNAVRTSLRKTAERAMRIPAKVSGHCCDAHRHASLAASRTLYVPRSNRALQRDRQGSAAGAGSWHTVLVLCMASDRH